MRLKPGSKSTVAEGRFRKYERLALSAANAVSRRTGVAPPELHDEALACLADLVVGDFEGYDEGRAALSTWVYSRVYSRVFSYCAKRGLRARREGAASTGLEEDRPQSRLEALLREVGEEGRALLRAVFEAPGDLACMLSLGAPARSARVLTRYLLDEEGRTRAEVKRAWMQVGEALYGEPLLPAAVLA